MKRFRVTVNGQTFEVEVEEIKESAATSQTRSTSVVSLQSEVAQKPPVTFPPAPALGTATASGSITAPMPGNILSIKVKEGEEVQAGKVLLILEAMKMENEIVAPQNGTVKKIYVTAGQSVNTGDLLLSLE